MTLIYPLQSLAAHPPRLSPGYKSTVKRSPSKPLIPMRHTLSELTGPVYGHETVRENDHDLTFKARASRSASASSCTAMCSTRTAAACRTRWSKCGRPMPAAAMSTSSISIPRRSIRTSPAPAARSRTREGYYRFVTIKPGAYPWGNHHNAWRPAHIHFSVFGHSFVSRLVTQMYFPGDPLFPFDPIFNSVTDEKARNRMVSVVRSGEHQAGLGAVLSLQHRAARPQRHADGEQISATDQAEGSPHRRPSVRISPTA